MLDDIDFDKVPNRDVVAFPPFKTCSGSGSGGGRKPPRLPPKRGLWEDDPDEPLPEHVRLFRQRLEGGRRMGSEILPFLWPKSGPWRHEGWGLGPWRVDEDLKQYGGKGLRLFDHVHRFRQTRRRKGVTTPWAWVSMPYPQGEPFPASGEIEAWRCGVGKRTMRWRVLPFPISWHMPGWSQIILFWPAEGIQPVDWTVPGFEGWDGQAYYSSAPVEWTAA